MTALGICIVMIFEVLITLYCALCLYYDDEIGGCVVVSGFGIGVFIVLILLLVSAVTTADDEFDRDIDYAVNKVNETNYENQKKVEDTCRAYISSYNADKITYETMIDSDPEVAKAAKIRANRTAAAYNEYYLKNSFVWSSSIPEDIREELEYIK